MRTVASLLMALALIMVPVVSAATQYTADLAWSTVPASEVDSYRIEKNSGGMWSEVGTVPADVTSFTDLGPLEASKDYCYRIVAVNATGSAISPVTCDTTPEGDPPLPLAPTAPTVTFNPIEP